MTAVRSAEVVSAALVKVVLVVAATMRLVNGVVRQAARGKATAVAAVLGVENAAGSGGNASGPRNGRSPTVAPDATLVWQLRQGKRAEILSRPPACPTAAHSISLPVAFG